MEDKFYSKILSLASIWWFGPLSGAVIAIGFTNIVGVCLCLLYYISNLSAISLNLILVMFCVVMLLFANIMLMLGGLKNRQQFLIPWLAITILALISAIVYCSINWGTLLEFKAPLVASMILSIYFIAVVSSFYHELVAPAEIQKHKEQAAVKMIIDKNATVEELGEEETVLVSLEHGDSLLKHPCPDEVIPIDTVRSNKNNPFTSNVFTTDETNEMSAFQITKNAPKDMNVKANFTPFKKSHKHDDKTPAKMRIFLPGSGGDESDFDFSFNDPDFDSSLCAQSHPEVEN